MITINDKFAVVLDPSTLKVGEAVPGFYKVSLAPIEEQLDILEDAVDDLFNILSPTTSYSMAQPNREGTTNVAGFITMVTIGLVFGLLSVGILLYGMGVI